MKPRENYSGFKGVFKFITSVISWTALVILILLALFLAYYTISTRIYSSKGEKFEPYVSLYTIVSGSMEPNIKVYDVVISKKIKNPKDIKVGDVITFVSTSSISKGMTVTHRVIEVKETEKGTVYRTKGDNNLSPDTAPAEFHNVIGKVILRVPQLGRVQSFIGTQSGWLIVIVIPALIIIISDILKIFKLAGVKNQIEQIDEDNKRMKRERSKREEIRKEEIRKRLRLEKSIYEIEPIVTQKPTRIVVAKKAPMQTDDISKEPMILSRTKARNAKSNRQNNSRKSKQRKNKR